MAKNKKGGVGKAVAIGAGVAAVGAGAYYFLGPKSKAHQKKARAFVGKVKREVKSDIKKASAVAKELKSEWKGAKKIIGKAKKSVGKIKKTVKKAVRSAKKRA